MISNYNHIDKIIELRDAKGWSNYKLCKEAGIAQSTLSDILNNKNANPGIHTLQKIFSVLSEDIDKVIECTSDTDLNKYDNEILAIAEKISKLSPNSKRIIKELLDCIS